MLVKFVHVKAEPHVLNMTRFATEDVQTGRFKVSVIQDDEIIGDCLRRGIEWDGWMRQDLPHMYKPGTDILDIGGNIGWNALMFSDYGPVHTFDPMFHEVIQKNVDQNNLAHPVKVHPYALSSSEGTLEFFVPKTETNGLRNYGGASLHPIPRDQLDMRYAGYEEQGIQVPVKTLDAVYSGIPSVIKLDVERHEIDVIRGAWRTIERHRPAMYIEILDPTNDEIVNMLQPLGYIMFPRPENNYLFICPHTPN